MDPSPPSGPTRRVVVIRLPPTHTTEGLTAALDLRGRHPGLGTLVLSTYVEAPWVRTLLDAFGLGSVAASAPDPASARRVVILEP